MVAFNKEAAAIISISGPNTQTLHPNVLFHILLSEDTREENKGLLDLWIMCVVIRRSSVTISDIDLKKGRMMNDFDG